MAKDSFDDLLQALQAAMVTAQAALVQKHEAALLRLSEAAGSCDGTRSPCFAYAIPHYGSHDYEMHSLPLASFRSFHRQQIARLSLEFACEFKESRYSGEQQLFSLVITSGIGSRWFWKKRQRMRIVFSGIDHPTGEVLINGRLFMEIPEYGEPLNSNSRPVPTQTLLSVITHLVAGYWRRQEFFMTPEQTKRARELLEQS